MGCSTLSNGNGVGRKLYEVALPEGKQELFPFFDETQDSYREGKMPKLQEMLAHWDFPGDASFTTSWQGRTRCAASSSICLDCHPLYDPPTRT